MKIWILSICFIGALACCRNDQHTLPTAADAALIGEWRYVGIFSHAADYSCMPCPGFDYQAALKLTLSASGELAGSSGVNQYGGTYQATVEDSSEVFQRGKIRVVMHFQTGKAGTPAKMQEENRFLDHLKKTTDYYVGFYRGSAYTGLSLNQSGRHEYLYFVRKN